MTIWVSKYCTPNNLTLARFGLSIIFFMLLSFAKPASNGTLVLDFATAVFILAGITDLADGYLARKYQMVTMIGRLLDPFADKILICGAFIFFCGSNFIVNGKNITDIAPWIVTVVVGRELLVTTLRGHSEATGKAFPATIVGKLKMLLQTITVIVILISIAHFSHEAWAKNLRITLIWIMIISTIGSMIAYILKYMKLQATKASEE
jgi:CDP-diacylglycerol--glycerol-3-phosphate 3-phosphatidyltransferase